MDKLVPVLRIVLLVAIAIIVIVMALEARANGLESAREMIYPLVSVVALYAFLAWSRRIAPKCPACGTQQPTLRKPSSLRQALFGGWTCPSCGTEIDRKGRPIAARRA
jgi:hypothetical protein